MNGCGDWLSEYVRIASLQSPLSPAEFHEAIGLWAVSTVIGRRLCAPMAHGDVFPNLWVMILAPSTLFAKTTAINIGRRLVEDVAPEALLPDTSTPEALLDSLAAMGQRGYIVDEASGLMSLSQRDYMKGTTELLLSLYDCPSTYRRKTRAGETKVSAAYLTMLSASTPALMKPYLREARLWAAGWWPRFALVVAPEQPLPFARALDVNGEWTRLAQALAALARRLDASPAQPLRVTFDRAALDAWNEYDRWARYDALLTLDLDTLRAAYGRSPTQALKVAVCLAALDWPRTERLPRVTSENMTRALDIARRWLTGAQRALELADQGEGDRRGDRIYALAAEAGEQGITLREVCRRTGWRATEVEMLLTELEAVERVRVEEISVRGGKQVRIYALPEGGG